LDRNAAPRRCSIGVGNRENLLFVIFETKFYSPDQRWGFGPRKAAQ